MHRVSLSGGRRRPFRARWGVAAFLLAAATALAVVAVALGGGGRGPAPVRSLAAMGPGSGDPVRALGGPPPGVRPGRAPRAAERTASRTVDRVLRYTPFVTSGIRRRRVVALTFDDGPSPYTGPIIRTLVRMHVPATFFVVGQQLRYFSAGLRDELQHGFTIGDHTVDHALLVRLGRAGQMGQIALDERILRGAGAPPVRLFRPPYGAYDRTTLAVLRPLRMLMILWSVDPGDWRRPGAGAIAGDVLRSVRPGAIVILHDGGGDRTQTIAALPAIINGLRRRRYRLVDVPELLSLDPPPRHQRLPPTIGA